MIFSLNVLNYGIFYESLNYSTSLCISDGGSSNSSGVLINKSDADDLDDDDDFDIDLDEDVNEEELAKMVQEIKDKSATGKLQVYVPFFLLQTRGNSIINIKNP